MVVKETSLIINIPKISKIKAAIKKQKSHFGGLYVFFDIVIFTYNDELSRSSAPGAAIGSSALLNVYIQTPFSPNG